MLLVLQITCTIVGRALRAGSWCMCILITWSACCLLARNVQASDMRDAVSSQTTQRFFTDTNSGLKWRFSARDGELHYSRSVDGFSWSEQGSLPYRAPFFSVSFRSVAGASFVVVAAENDRGDIVVRRGRLLGRSLQFDSEVVVYEKQRDSYRYTKPAITIAPDGIVWIASVRVRMWLGERYQVVSSRSVDTVAAFSLGFTEKLLVGKPLAAVASLAIVPLSSQEIMVALSGESNSNVVTHRYAQGAWHEASAGGDFASSAFAGADLNGTVRALTFNRDGNLFAAGTFSAADGMPAFNIAIWNGNRWSPLGPGLNGTVLALAADADGKIYAGGEFTKAGGIATRHVAVWDGIEWKELGGGTDGTVRAIAVSSRGGVVVAGDFTRAGDMSANRIAEWQGEAWMSLGSGVRAADSHASVHALAIDGADIYVAGVFSAAGDVATRGIAQWDGSRWRPCGSGLDGDGFALTTTSRGEVYVAGNFSKAGGVVARNIARWDGLVWSALGDGVSGLVAAGALVTDAFNRLYIAGDFEIPGDQQRYHALIWNGSTWTPPHSRSIQSGPPGALNATARALTTSPSGGIVLAGDFERAGEVNVGHVATFNLSDDAPSTRFSGEGTWGALSHRGINGPVHAALVSPSGELYVGGSFTRIGGIDAQRVARWDGERWYGVGDGFDGPVRALEVSQSGLVYAGGEFSASGNEAVSNVAVLLNGRWRRLANGINGPVYTLALGPANELYVGGAFTDASGVVANNIAVWSGAQWMRLNEGLDGAVLTLAVGPQGQVFAGGEFQRASNLQVNRIAVWINGGWQQLGSGASDVVRRIISDTQGSLLAAGDFVSMNGQRVNYISRWDGFAWSALSEGVDGPVTAMTRSNHGSTYLATTGGDTSGTPTTNLWSWSRAWMNLGGLPTGRASTLAVATDSNGKEALYIAEGSVLSTLDYMAASHQMPASAVSMVVAETGDVHMFFIDSQGSACMRTFSFSTKTWGARSVIHRGAVTSLFAQLDPLSGQITVWLRDGKEIVYGESKSPYLSFSITRVPIGSRLHAEASQMLEDSAGLALLYDWEVNGSDDGGQIISPPVLVPSATPTPPPSADPISYISIDLLVQRNNNDPFVGASIPGLGLEVQEELGGYTVAIHRGITSVDGHLQVPIVVRADADLTIRARDPRLARLEVSGPATEFLPERNFVATAEVMIQPLSACRKVTGIGTDVMFKYRNLNAQQAGLFVPITGLDPTLVGKPYDRSDDLLLNSVDYSGEKRVIPISGGIVETGEELKQWFSGGEGAFSINYDPTFGPLTWNILGAAISVNDTTSICPDEQSSARCSSIDRTRFTAITTHITSTSRTLQRAYARNNSRMRSQIRTTASRAIKAVSVMLSEIDVAVDCSALSTLPAACRQVQAPSGKMVAEYKKLFSIQLRGSAVIKLRKFQRTAIAEYLSVIQNTIPSVLGLCGGA